MKGKRNRHPAMTQSIKQEPEQRCELESSQRRIFLGAALVAGLGLPLIQKALADETSSANERPQAGDHFVFAQGENEGTEIKASDLPLNGPPALVWPKDPKTGVVRDGSRLNQVLLLRLDSSSFGDETQANAADGIVAYSAICTHAQCPVNGWVEEEGKWVLKCFCHNSEYDPRQNAQVVFGPAPRRLPAPPIKVEDGDVVARGTFLGRVGFHPS